LEALGFEKTRIGALNRGFEFVADHGVGAPEGLDKFSVFRLGRYHTPLLPLAPNGDPDDCLFPSL
ncbi:hypothetical protein, partial [Pseudomonas sp.]|uniref:hypothetical protein n=1 Tax=Pseudomonas sp. TaxID=306 RepID=UPI002FC655B5